MGLYKQHCFFAKWLCSQGIPREPRRPEEGEETCSSLFTSCSCPSCPATALPWQQHSPVAEGSSPVCSALPEPAFLHTPNRHCVRQARPQLRPLCPSPQGPSARLLKQQQQLFQGSPAWRSGPSFGAPPPSLWVPLRSALFWVPPTQGVSCFLQSLLLCVLPPLFLFAFSVL